MVRHPFGSEGRCRCFPNACVRPATTFATGKWHNGEASFVPRRSSGAVRVPGGMADHEVPVVDVTHGVVGPQRIAEKFSSEQFADAAISSHQCPAINLTSATSPSRRRMILGIRPEAYRQRYYRKPPPLPTNFLPVHPFDNRFARDLRRNLAAYPRPVAAIRINCVSTTGSSPTSMNRSGRSLDAIAASRAPPTR